MRGKLIEDVQFLECVRPAQRTSAVTLYNGSAVAVSNNGIDTQPCDEIVFVVSAGTFEGAAALDADVVASNTNNPATAVLVAGRGSPLDAAANAAFTQITVANDNQLHMGSIKAKNWPRYMWLRTYQTAVTTYYGAIAAKGKCDRDPQANAPVFDLNY